MRLRFSLSILSVFFVAFAVVPALALGQGDPAYDVIGPVPPPHSQDRIRMEEFVNFTCPHCNNFRLMSKPVLEKYGKRLEVTLVPITFRGQTDTPLRLYFIAEREGRGPEIAAIIFDATFRYGVNVYDPQIVSYLARSAGLADAYEKEAQADWVTAKVKEARKRADEVGLEATPTIVLNGALRLVPKTRMETFVATLDRLIGDLLKN